jgi:tetratricopeptide (TPR) repeat protein
VDPSDETLSLVAGPAKPAAPAAVSIPGYRIARALGSGGMGTVYEAFEERMNRRVALKVLQVRVDPASSLAHRFVLEAWIGGRLDHPNLVKVFDQGNADGLPWYSMEIVDGGSLADVVRSLRKGGRDDRLGLTYGTREYVEWAVRQVITAACGLHFAHENGVVHRDVKPANLLMSGVLGALKVADFGLAIEADTTRMTADGAVLGTVGYMAPEQIVGKKESIDRRADVYALGVTLFELLTLELPYHGRTQQIYSNAVLTSAARRARTLNQRVSRDLDVVIQKALEKEPRDRYATAAAFADDLDNVLRFLPIVARPPGLPARIAKWARRRPMHAALLGLLLAGVPTTLFLAERAVEHRRLVRSLRLDELRSRVRFLAQRGEQRGVIAAATEMLSLAPADVSALRSRAVASMYLALATADPEQAAALREGALADADCVVSLLPAAAWPLRFKAFVLGNFGRAAEARDAETDAARLRPAAPGDDDLDFDARLAMLRGEPRAAVDLYTQLIARHPNRIDYIGLRGDAYDALGDGPKAIDDYRLVAALDPDSFYVHHSLGRVYTGTGALDEGAGHIRRAIQIEPDNPYGHETLSDNLYRASRAAFDRGDRAAGEQALTAAEAEARKALSLKDDMPWSHLNLGAILMERSRLAAAPDRALLEESLAHDRTALRLAGGSRDGASAEARVLALSNSCDALIQMRALDDALTTCQEATRGTTRPDPYYNLAGVYALLGRADEAFAALEEDFSHGDRDSGYLAADPWFVGLRHDPRFAALTARMKKD